MLSQPIFCLLFECFENLVSDWERGKENRVDSALKLLNVIQNGALRRLRSNGRADCNIKASKVRYTFEYGMMTLH